ncbi:hypothetical protein BGX26_004509, partial [Mortierella sp. AD094]
MDPESATLIPDYGTATLIGEQRYFVLLLEGKITGNAGQCQMWDESADRSSYQLEQAVGNNCIFGLVSLIGVPLVLFEKHAAVVKGIEFALYILKLRVVAFKTGAFSSKWWQVTLDVANGVCCASEDLALLILKPPSELEYRLINSFLLYSEIAID